MQESLVENFLLNEVRKAGGECLKFVSPGTNGVPDRIVLLPGGIVRFVETKAPGERPRATQRVIHRRLAALGSPVAVIDTKEKVTMFMEGLTNGI